MTDDQLAIGGQLGTYLIDSVIGRGGMSVVYRARHSRLGMWVALKVLAPELGSDDAFRERFLREAQMAAAVDHPNVIPIHDMGVHEGSLYIVMRYVAGGDLKALLAGGQHRPPARRCGCSRRSPRRSTPRTPAASSTATSSPPTSCSSGRRTERSSTST